MSDSTIRSVVIRIALEQVDSTIKVPDFSPVIAGQAQVAESTNQASQAFREESRVVGEAAQSHERHTGGLMHAARPLNMLISGTQHLIHATIMLTAANEEDAQAMVKKFMAYEAYFGLVHGGIHVMHALTHITEIFAGVSVASAAASALAFAPVIAAIALVAGGLYLAHEAFDAFGLKAKAAREETEKFEKAFKDFFKAANPLVAQQQVGKDKVRDEEDALKVQQNGLGLLEQLDLLEKNRAETAALLARNRAVEHQNTELITREAERLKDQDSKRLDITLKMRSAIYEEIEAQEKLIQLAKDALKAEQDKNASIRQRLGMLNEAEQAEAKMLGDRIAGGTGSFEDKKRFATLTGITEPRDTEAGERGAGLAKDFERKGFINNREKEFEDKIKDAEAGAGPGGGGTIADKRDRIRALDKEVRELGDLVRKDLKDLGDAMTDHYRKLHQELQDILNKALGVKANAKAANG